LLLASDGAIIFFAGIDPVKIAACFAERFAALGYPPHWHFHFTGGGFRFPLSRSQRIASFFPAGTANRLEL